MLGRFCPPAIAPNLPEPVRPEAQWMEMQEDDALLERSPNGLFRKEESKLRFNASRALEEFSSSIK